MFALFCCLIRNYFYTNASAIREIRCVHFCPKESPWSCLAGKNWVVLTYSDVVREVQPFTDKYDSIKEVPIVTACAVWTDPNSGKEYLLCENYFFGLDLH